VTITNTGNASATSTMLTDVLPLGVTYTASSPSCSYASLTRTVTCNLGTIPAAGNAAVQITVKPRSEGTLNNTATITASQWDPATGNSSASVNGLPAVKFVDLAVQVVGSANPIFTGQTVTYTITAKNLGTPFSATNVIVMNTLPAGMSYMGMPTTSQGSADPVAGQTQAFHLGSIAPGVTATMTVTAKSTAAGLRIDSATASATEAESNPADNTDSAGTTVKDAALLKVLLASQVLTGGGCTTGNVYLTGPAGPGGVNVPLSTSGFSPMSVVSTPASVFIPEGQTVSPAFNVTTTTTPTKQVGLVIAGSGPGAVSRGLTINVGSGSCPP
jgi:uncharacterized repeat protein (TIGR01451 family)